SRQQATPRTSSAVSGGAALAGFPAAAQPPVVAGDHDAPGAARRPTPASCGWWARRAPAGSVPARPAGPAPAAGTGSRTRDTTGEEERALRAYASGAGLGWCQLSIAVAMLAGAPVAGDTFSR